MSGYFFLSSDDSAEFNLVNNALLSIFKMDAKGKGHIFLIMSVTNLFQVLAGMRTGLNSVSS